MKRIYPDIVPMKGFLRRDVAIWVGAVGFAILGVLTGLLIGLWAISTFAAPLYPVDELPDVLRAVDNYGYQIPAQVSTFEPKLVATDYAHTLNPQSVGLNK